jgi:c-di-GMP-binding flagellar brake protein YcgR
MSSGKIEKKEIFSQISNINERVRVLKSAVNEMIAFVCKGNGINEQEDSLFYFQPDTVSKNGILKGRIILIEGVPTEGEVIANFGVNKEKYFYRSKLSIKNNIPFVLTSEQMFKLQRRAHFRMGLASASEKSIIIIGLNGKKVFVDAECMDFSVGGARMLLPKSALKIKIGDRISPVLRINGKRFETEAEVRHIKEDKENVIVGIKFSVSDQVLLNRLQVLSLEFQRKMTQDL